MFQMVSLVFQRIIVLVFYLPTGTTGGSVSVGTAKSGSVAFGELWGPMREETNAWLSRVALGNPTHHATATEAHDRLMLTKAMDLSARRKRPIALPITPEDEKD